MGVAFHHNGLPIEDVKVQERFQGELGKLPVLAECISAGRGRGRLLLEMLLQGILDLHAREDVWLVAPEKSLIDEAQLLLELHHFLALVLLAVEVSLDVGRVAIGTLEL